MKKLLALGLICCYPGFCGYLGYVLFQTIPSQAGSSLTSPYSLLLTGTFPAFATVANGGQVVNTTSCGVNSIVCPADLIFAEDSGCSEAFGGWDVISYSPVTGQLTAAVEIPLLSNTRPVKIYGCVGNAAVTSFQGGPQGSAYDSNYLLALHMEEGTGTTLYDSTANANNAIRKANSSPAPTASGRVGGGQRFTGTANSTNNDYALFQTPTALTNTYTIEYWTNATSYIDYDSVFLESSSGEPNVMSAFFWFPAGSVIYRNSWGGLSPTAPVTVPPGAFHYIVFARNGDSMNVFVDGVAGTAASGFGTGMERWKGLGWDGGPGSANSFNGIMDEVFYSNIARSPDYVTARYNNISSPSTFYSVSPFTINKAAPPSTTRANSQVTIFTF